MKNKIIELAKKCSADIVGFASADRFEKDDAIFKILPETKTVIALAFRVLRGAYRGIEEGSTYYQYTTMGVENMEETIANGKHKGCKFNRGGGLYSLTSAQTPADNG